MKKGSNGIVALFQYKKDRAINGFPILFSYKDKIGMMDVGIIVSKSNVKWRTIMEDKSFSKDPRFKIAKKEALIGTGLAIFNFIWWYGFAYGLGSGSPKDYNYILGFPEWFFYSCIGGLILMSIIVVFIIKRFFTDVSFDEAEVEKLD